MESIMHIYMVIKAVQSGDDTNLTFHKLLTAPSWHIGIQSFPGPIQLLT